MLDKPNWLTESAVVACAIRPGPAARTHEFHQRWVPLAKEAAGQDINYCELVSAGSFVTTIIIVRSSSQCCGHEICATSLEKIADGEQFSNLPDKIYRQWKQSSPAHGLPSSPAWKKICCQMMLRSFFNVTQCALCRKTLACPAWFRFKEPSIYLSFVKNVNYILAKSIVKKINLFL